MRRFTPARRISFTEVQGISISPCVGRETTTRARPAVLRCATKSSRDWRRRATPQSVEHIVLTDLRGGGTILVGILGYLIDRSVRKHDRS